MVSVKLKETMMFLANTLLLEIVVMENIVDFLIMFRHMQVLKGHVVIRVDGV